MSSPGISKPQPPCKPGGKNCELRGTEVCHTDRCPYGWAEFQKKSEEWRSGVLRARRLDDILWR